MKLIVTGSMAVLFEKHELEVNADAGQVKVPAFRCRWCGWTVVTDKRGPLPDHECTGPAT